MSTNNDVMSPSPSELPLSKHGTAPYVPPKMSRRETVAPQDAAPEGALSPLAGVDPNADVMAISVNSEGMSSATPRSLAAVAEPVEEVPAAELIEPFKGLEVVQRMSEEDIWSRIGNPPCPADINRKLVQTERYSRLCVEVRTQEDEAEVIRKQCNFSGKVIIKAAQEMSAAWHSKFDELKQKTTTDFLEALSAEMGNLGRLLDLAKNRSHAVELMTAREAFVCETMAAEIKELQAKLDAKTQVELEKTKGEMIRQTAYGDAFDVLEGAFVNLRQTMIEQGAPEPIQQHAFSVGQMALRGLRSKQEAMLSSEVGDNLQNLVDKNHRLEEKLKAAQATMLENEELRTQISLLQDEMGTLRHREGLVLNPSALLSLRQRILQTKQARLKVRECLRDFNRGLQRESEITITHVSDVVDKLHTQAGEADEMVRRTVNSEMEAQQWRQFSVAMMHELQKILSANKVVTPSTSPQGTPGSTGLTPPASPRAGARTPPPVMTPRFTSPDAAASLWGECKALLANELAKFQPLRSRLMGVVAEGNVLKRRVKELLTLPEQWKQRIVAIGCPLPDPMPAGPDKDQRLIALDALLNYAPARNVGGGVGRFSDRDTVLVPSNDSKQKGGTSPPHGRSPSVNLVSFRASAQGAASPLRGFSTPQPSKSEPSKHTLTRRQREQHHSPVPAMLSNRAWQHVPRDEAPPSGDKRPTIPSFDPCSQAPVLSDAKHFPSAVVKENKDAGRVRSPRRGVTSPRPKLRSSRVGASKAEEDAARSEALLKKHVSEARDAVLIDREEIPGRLRGVHTEVNTMNATAAAKKMNESFQQASYLDSLVPTSRNTSTALNTSADYAVSTAEVPKLLQRRLEHGY